MSCTHRFNQGRACTCAAVQFFADAEGVMTMATGCSTKAAPRPEPDALEATHLSLTQTLLIAVILLACTGICAFIVLQLAERIPF